jgi:hypothetical protein
MTRCCCRQMSVFIKSFDEGLTVFSIPESRVIVVRYKSK